MPRLALLLWLVYGVTALGARVAIHLRRTGSTGLVGAKAPTGTLRWFAEVGHVVALGLGVSAPILDLTGTIPPIGALDRSPAHVAGTVVFAIGLAGVIVSQSAMRNSWRIGTDPQERTALVTHGPFAVVRNPIYTSLAATLLGLALVVPNVVSLASVILFVVVFEAETRSIEEPHLLAVHGEGYRRYAARVGRFVPGIGRLRG
jgi:protein-S-isoprenylcysteine O-methyltransferase Ste14